MPKTKNYPKEIKENVCKLRKNGWSIGEISKELHIRKNTISGWVKEIRLTDKQKKRIKEKEIAGAARGRILAAKVLQEKMQRWKESIRKGVRHFSKIPFKNANIGKFTCALLYLCEGGKYPSTRQLTFSNSDPKMIKFFLLLLRKYFDINEKKFRCRIQHRHDQNPKKLREFWSNITKIPPNQFYREYFDKRTINSPTKKKDYKGICNLQYHNTNLQFELQSIGEIVINGFEG